MTVRTTSVRLRAEVSGYVAGLGQASRATRSFVDDARNGSRTLAKELQSVQTQAGIVGAALLALPAAAIAVNTAFDKQMSGVAAVTGATADEMDRLRTAAIKAGQATAYSASDAASAEAELAKAGIQTSEILGGALTGSLSLAAAGQIDLADAATLSAQAMNAFGLHGRDVSHIADVLAAGANKSAADVGQLGDALRQGALIADQTGLSLEDTVGVLSAFADRAMVGSDAGTSLKTMLMRLTPQSQQAADMIDQLGVRAYDAKGDFIGLEAWAGKLQKGMQKLSPEARNAAMNIIFGSDAARAAGVVYDLGAKGIHEYTKAVDDQGAATRMAAVQMDNLAGDLEQLRGSIETALIQSGSGANGVLRDMAQAGTGVVNFIGSLPGPTLDVGLAVATMSGAFLIAAPRIAAVNDALAANPKLAKAAALGMRALGPIAIATAIGTLALDMQAANQRTDDLDASLRRLYGTLGQHVSATALDELRQQITDLQTATSDPGFIKNLENGLQDAWNSRPKNPLFLRNANDADMPFTSNLQQQSTMLEEARAKYATFTEAVGNAAYMLGTTGTRAQQLAIDGGIKLNGNVADMTASIVEYGQKTSTGSAATHKAAAAMEVLAESTSSAEDKLKAYKDQWDSTFGVLLGTSNAQIQVEAAIDDLTESLKKNGNQWSLNTAAGRENMAAFNNVVSGAEAVREKMLEQGASLDTANAAYKGYLQRVAAAPGLTDKERAAVQKLIDKYDDLPPSKTSHIDIETAAATAALERLKTYWSSTVSWIEAHPAYAAAHYGYTPPATKPKKKLAGGGWVDGPGTPTSDSVDIRASRREYVVNARAAAANASLLDAMNYGRQLPLGAQVAASGGAAGAPTIIVQIPPTVRPADRALIREQVTGAVQEAMAGVGGQIAWRGHGQGGRG